MMGGFHGSIEFVLEHFHSHDLDPIDTVNNPLSNCFPYCSYTIGTAFDIATVSARYGHRFATAIDPGAHQKSSIKGVSQGNI
jgi:hypothetical protein